MGGYWSKFLIYLGELAVPVDVVTSNLFDYSIKYVECVLVALA